jgi:hypothetical protein
VSWCLSESGIARDEGLGRGWSEFLYSASEVFPLKIRADVGEQIKEGERTNRAAHDPRPGSGADAPGLLAG